MSVYSATNNTAEISGFPSLTALRQRHVGLIEQRRTSKDSPEFLAEVAHFIERARSTGVLLDDLDDRWSCQSLLDYWANVLDRVGYPSPDPTLAEFNPALAPTLDDTLCPYVGLDAFQESSHSLFYGRQRIIGELAQHIQAQRLVIVVGPSGSGKSSLVMGGLLPQLKAGLEPGSDQWNYYPPAVPGANPLIRLARLAMVQSGPNDASTQEQASALTANDRHLLDLLNQKGTSSLIIIDQFEEIFTLVSDEQMRQAFVDNLLQIVQAPGVQHRLILTMRSDFEERVVLLPQLQPLFESAQFRITPLNASELREAIEQPAQQIGLKFEAGVVDQLVHDILGEPAALPLLQFTLLKLWEGRDHNRVTLDMYRRLGGGRLALSRTADSLYDSLIPEDQRALQRILLRLARPSDGLEITSNRVRRQTLYHAGEAPYRVDSVLDKLIKARLIRRTPGDNYNDDRIEVAHEALIRNWPRLIEWLDEARVTMRRRLRLTADAERWAGHGRSQDTLLRGELLAEALRYDDLNELEHAYVAASEAMVAAEREQQMQQKLEVVRAEERAEAARQRVREQTRANFRLRIALGALALLFLFSLVAAILVAAFAFDAATARGRAQTAQATAEKNAQLAQTAQATAEKNAQLAQQAQTRAEEKERISTSLQLAVSARTVNLRAPDLSLLLGIEARRIADTSESRDVLQTVLSQQFRPLAYLQGHTNGIEDIAFSPDNSMLASASTDGLVLLWDTKTNRVSGRPLIDKYASVYSVAFSPDGKSLAAGTDLGDVLLWNVGEHTLNKRYRLFSDTVRVARFRPDGTAIAASGCLKHDLNGNCNEYSVSLLNLSSGTSELLPISSDKIIRTLDFSPDGRNLAIGDDRGDVIVWDMNTHQARVFQKDADAIWTVAFSPDGQILAAGGLAGRIQLWKIKDGTNVQFEELNLIQTVSRINWTRDGKTIIAVDLDGKLSVWDLQHLQFRGIYSIHRAAVDGLVLSPDGTKVATGARDGQLTLWDASNLSELSTQTLALSTSQHMGALELLATSSNPPYQQLTGHPITARSVAYSHDGRFIATAGNDHAIVLRDTTTKQVVGEPLRKHTDWIYNIAFSPDDHLLASSSADHSVILWDAAKRQPLAELDGHSSAVYAIAFSPDGKVLASAGCHQPDADNSCQQGEIRLWDVATHKQIGTPLLGHTNLIWSIAFSKDGTLASGGWDDQILRWNIQTGQTIGAALKGHTDDVYDLAFSPDGALLASAGRDKKAIVWDAQAGTERYELPEATSSLNAIVFSPDGSQIATGGWDNQIRRWDVKTGKSLAVPLSVPSAVQGLAFSPDGSIIAAANDDGTLAFWQLATGDMLETPIPSHFARIRTVALSPDGKLAATGAEDNTIILWDTTTHLAIHKLQGHTSYVLSLAFSHDGKMLVSGSGDHTVRFWDAASGTPITNELTLDDPVTSIAVSPDDKIIAAGGCQTLGADQQCQTGEVRLWNVADQTPIGQPIASHANYVWALAFSPDGKLLASGGDEHIRLWNAADGQAIGSLDGHTASVRSLAFSPDGSLLASGAADDKVILWQTATRTQSGEALTEHTDWVSSVAFTPDGKLIAAASDDNSIIFWNTADHKQIGNPLMGHTNGVASIAIGSDFLVSGGFDGKIILWGNPTSLEDLACNVAQRNLTLGEWNTYFPGKPYHLTCPKLDIDHFALKQAIDESVNMLRAGEQEAATKLISDTAAWARTTENADIANSICRYGSLGGFADIMRSTCEYAAKIDNISGSAQGTGRIRDSRGIMYALTDDNERAKDDFQYFINWAQVQIEQGNDADKYRADIAKRRFWIEQLKAGKKPLDASTIRQLQENE